jgi:hypothetical protein
LFCINKKCFQTKVTKKDKKNFLDISSKLGRKSFKEVGSEERTPHSKPLNIVDQKPFFQVLIIVIGV